MNSATRQYRPVCFVGFFFLFFFLVQLTIQCYRVCFLPWFGVCFSDRATFEDFVYFDVYRMNKLCLYDELKQKRRKHQIRRRKKTEKNNHQLDKTNLFFLYHFQCTCSNWIIQFKYTSLIRFGWFKSRLHRKLCDQIEFLRLLSKSYCLVFQLYCVIYQLQTKQVYFIMKPAGGLQEQQ